MNIFISIDKNNSVELLTKEQGGYATPDIKTFINKNPNTLMSAQRAVVTALCFLLHTDLHNLPKHKAAVKQWYPVRNTITWHAKGKETSSNMRSTAGAKRRCSWGLTWGAEDRSPSLQSVFDGDAAALMEGGSEQYCWSLPRALAAAGLHSVRWERTEGPQKLEESFLRWCFTVFFLEKVSWYFGDLLESTGAEEGFSFLQRWCQKRQSPSQVCAWRGCTMCTAVWSLLTL